MQVKCYSRICKTGLDMANFFGVTQNGDRLDYGQFFNRRQSIMFDDLEKQMLTLLIF